MREAVIEDYLVKQVKIAGGIARKLVWIGCVGAPDRLVLLPPNHLVFVELKAPGKKPRPTQVLQIKLLRNYGCEVEVIDSKEQIDNLIEKYS